MPRILYGAEPAKKIKDWIIEKIPNKRAMLAIVKVGNNPASEIYVRNKVKDCEECGFGATVYHLPESVTPLVFTEVIEELNENNLITGIIVQKPLPAGLPNPAGLIDPAKDIDCFTIKNMGKLYQGIPAFQPCTPHGIMLLLEHYGINVTGMNCVVIGRSEIVGKPMAILLTQADATVTLCHSKTRNLEFYTKNADLIVCAIGSPKFLKADMIKEGAILIDVGINRDENGSLCGDIDYDDVYEKCGAITPVPGGVGLMTRAAMLENLWLSQ